VLDGRSGVHLRVSAMHHTSAVDLRVGNTGIRGFESVLTPAD
jgi:hypothetical protein